MNKITFLLIICAVLTQSSVTAQTPAQKLANLFDSKSKKTVLVTAHRGDWRNTPENSMQCVLNSIRMGVDIAEIDLKKTKDGELVLMHDNTIDRTTTGKGKVEDYTLAELQKFKLRSGTSHSTAHIVPTFREIMLAAKGRIIINVDKGYIYFPQVVQILRETGTANQAIININENLPLDSVIASFGAVDKDLYLMPIVRPERAQRAIDLIKSYQPHALTVIQAIYATDTAALINRLPAVCQSFPIWMNGLWPEQNGGHDDDRAVEKGEIEESWGWLIQKGAVIIQTDRPKELMEYVKKKGLSK